jgi:hypothetical protein
MSGAKLEWGGVNGGGGGTPPKIRITLDWQGKSSGLAGRIIWIGRANHLDWQGESSGLAGRIIWIGRAIKDFK